MYVIIIFKKKEMPVYKALISFASSTLKVLNKLFDTRAYIIILHFTRIINLRLSLITFYNTKYWHGIVIFFYIFPLTHILHVGIESLILIPRSVWYFWYQIKMHIKTSSFSMNQNEYNVFTLTKAKGNSFAQISNMD